jgi:hypothetical protein
MAQTDHAGGGCAAPASDVLADACDANEVCGVEFIMSRAFAVVTARGFDYTFQFDLECAAGRLDMAKWLHSRCTVAAHSKAFRFACGNGHLDVAQWLASIGRAGDTRPALRNACLQGHLHVVQWLVQSMGADVHADHEAAFACACEAGRLAVAQWLLEGAGADLVAGRALALEMALRFHHNHVAAWLLQVSDGACACAEVTWVPEHVLHAQTTWSRARATWVRSVVRVAAGSVA